MLFKKKLLRGSNMIRCCVSKICFGAGNNGSGLWLYYFTYRLLIITVLLYVFLSFIIFWASSWFFGFWICFFLLLLIWGCQELLCRCTVHNCTQHHCTNGHYLVHTWCIYSYHNANILHYISNLPPYLWSIPLISLGLKALLPRPIIMPGKSEAFVSFCQIYHFVSA